MLRRAYKRLAEKLKLTVPVLVKGGVRVEEGSNSKLMIGDITPLEAGEAQAAAAICASRFRWRPRRPTMIDELHALCQERKGEARVLFDLERKGDFTVVMEAEGYNVLPDRAFINRVEELCGRGSVRVVD